MTLTDTQIQSATLAGLGFFVTLATSLLKNINASRKSKHTITVVLSALTAAVSSYFQKNGTLDLEDMLKHSAYLYAVSQMLYVYGLKNTQVNAWLTSLNVLPSKKG
ncbi:MAG: hypothetical protein EB127_03235 [Alphaproteobacteria bacterium]|nr:hypothetical protein [Alphaproteobacteria bacterium]